MYTLYVLVACTNRLRTRLTANAKRVSSSAVVGDCGPRGAQDWQSGLPAVARDLHFLLTGLACAGVTWPGARVLAAGRPATLAPSVLTALACRISGLLSDRLL